MLDHADGEAVTACHNYEATPISMVIQGIFSRSQMRISSIAASRINTHMRINEVTDGLRRYVAMVRVKANSTQLSAKTSIEAEGQMQARTMLCHIYGDTNVQSVTQSGGVCEASDGVKVLSADELKVKSLADQARRLKQSERQERARQSLAKAQERMRKVQQSGQAIPNRSG